MLSCECEQRSVQIFRACRNAIASHGVGVGVVRHHQPRIANGSAVIPSTRFSCSYQDLLFLARLSLRFHLIHHSRLLLLDLLHIESTVRLPSRRLIRSPYIRNPQFKRPRNSIRQSNPHTPNLLPQHLSLRFHNRSIIRPHKRRKRYCDSLPLSGF